MNSISTIESKFQESNLDPVDIAGKYIILLNDSLRKTGLPNDVIKYVSHRFGKDVFIIDAEAPYGLERWICGLQFLSGIRINSKKVFFTLSIPQNDTPIDRIDRRDTRKRISELLK